MDGVTLATVYPVRVLRCMTCPGATLHNLSGCLLQCTICHGVQYSVQSVKVLHCKSAQVLHSTLHNHLSNNNSREFVDNRLFMAPHLVRAQSA